MERLTEWVKDCPEPEEIYRVWVKDHDYIVAARRLAEYEDTGLTPDEVEHLKVSEMGKAIANITEFNGVPIQRLKELAAAEKSGDIMTARHAEWEWFDELNGNPLEGQDRDWGWRCSGCKTALPDDYDDPDCKPKIKYCPECGAKMDGGSDKGDYGI